MELLILGLILMGIFGDNSKDDKKAITSICMARDIPDCTTVRFD